MECSNRNVCNYILLGRNEICAVIYFSNMQQATLSKHQLIQMFKYYFKPKPGKPLKLEHKHLL